MSISIGHRSSAALRAHAPFKQVPPLSPLKAES